MQPLADYQVDLSALHQLLVSLQYVKIHKTLTCIEAETIVQYATLMPNNGCFLAIFAILPKCQFVELCVTFADGCNSGPELHACYAECKS